MVWHAVKIVTMAQAASGKLHPLMRGCTPFCGLFEMCSLCLGSLDWLIKLVASNSSEIPGHVYFSSDVLHCFCDALYVINHHCASIYSLGSCFIRQHHFPCHKILG